MIPKGLFTQIGMIVISVTIVTTYIQPSFAEVGKIQDGIVLYQEERGKIVMVNSQLANLVSKMESTSAEDQRRLLTYLPDSVDEIAVSRDLLLITNQAGVLYKDVKYDESGPSAAGRKTEIHETGSDAHGFTLSVEGTYGQLKNLFSLLEQNNYPFEVHGVEMQKSEGGFLTAEIKLVTYSFRNDIISEEATF